MQEYYFLFGLAFVWTLFATIQDLKQREVANWLNFSLIAFALVYRAFYSIEKLNYKFFLLGLCGFAVFFILAHALYYSRAFAGGDAKLLMGFGIILPYQRYSDLIYLPILFTFALFLCGSIYSLAYSVYLVSKNKKQFKIEFKRRFKKYATVQIISIIVFLILLSLKQFYPFSLLFSFFFLIPLILIYTKSLEKCMIKLYTPNKLTEGDWLEKNVKIGNKTIMKTVHGLSKEDIIFLKKHNKSVYVKEGIPFVPAFLITLLIMLYVFLILKVSPDLLLSFLS